MPKKNNIKKVLVIGFRPDHYRARQQSLIMQAHRLAVP